MECKNKNKLCFIILIVLLVLVFIVSLIFGSTSLSLKEVFTGLFGKEDHTIVIIMQKIRLPRILAAIVAGIGLSISGLLLQSLTNNKLASPNIIGVNSGAGLAIIVFLTFFPSLVSVLPIASFLGAFVSTLLILFISNRLGNNKSIIILVGIALTTILNALISFITIINPDASISYNYFSIGGLLDVSLNELIIPGILIMLSLIISLIIARKIEILSLGDSLATSLGEDVKKIRVVALICASLAAASVVSFAGLLGFVGLVVPHIARRLNKGNLRSGFIISSLVGSIIVMFADMLGRIIFAPSELPVGILMALIGAPFFLVLLFKEKNYVRD